MLVLKRYPDAQESDGLWRALNSSVKERLLSFVPDSIQQVCRVDEAVVDNLLIMMTLVGASRASWPADRACCGGITQRYKVPRVASIRKFYLAKVPL